MHVATVIPPATALRRGRLVDDGLPFLKPRDHRRRGQRAAGSDEVAMHAVREIESVLRVTDQLRMQAARHVGGIHAIHRRLEHCALLIPRDVEEFAVGRGRGAGAAANGIPVLHVPPILMADVEVVQHVVDERGHIEVALHRLVERVGGRRGLGDHRGINICRPRAHPAFVDHVVVRLAPPVVFAEAAHRLPGRNRKCPSKSR